jgi:hypothetical protein
MSVGNVRVAGEKQEVMEIDASCGDAGGYGLLDPL